MKSHRTRRLWPRAGTGTTAERVAEEFVRLADEALRTGSRFTVALAGSSSPQQMYTRLAGAQVDWEHVHFFWGDERCVPPGHADSNYRPVLGPGLPHGR